MPGRSAPPDSCPKALCVCMGALKHKHILFCSTIYNTSRGQGFIKTEDRSGAGAGVCRAPWASGRIWVLFRESQRAVEAPEDPGLRRGCSLTQVLAGSLWLQEGN